MAIAIIPQALLENVKKIVTLSIKIATKLNLLFLPFRKSVNIMVRTITRYAPRKLGSINVETTLFLCGSHLNPELKTPRSGKITN
jgi:hypothetical protein